MKMTKKYKHLTLQDRNYIEEALTEKTPLFKIARRLRKDPTTISKEIKRNRVVIGKARKIQHERCLDRKNCQITELCSEKCGRVCSRCKTKNCYKICSVYKPEECKTIKGFPHVCNSCAKRARCSHEKYGYRAKTAYMNYQDVLSESREGISKTEKEMKKLEKLISPLALRGQSIAHIYVHHKEEIKCSERTLYSYFEQNLFTAKNIDLPRKVKYKPRKKRVETVARNSGHRLGRTYEDFKEYISNHPEDQVVEMDTVHGTKENKTLLTLLFRSSSLMLSFVLERCTSDAVKKVFDGMYETLGEEVFRKTFPVILTDNGSEFKIPEVLEEDKLGNNRTRVFYCDPMASHQKGRIEKNHEYIRYIVPKGRSFEPLTQEKVNLMMSRINSTARASLNGNPPLKLAQLLLDESVLKLCSQALIPADEVHLKPALLRA